MKVLLFLLGALLGVGADPVYLEDGKWQEWEDWKTTFNRQYGSDDENFNRFAIWSDNRDFVNQWNAEEEGFSIEMNQFADMTETEFKTKVLGYSAKAKGSCKKQHNASAKGLPDSVDWRPKGYVTKVKNQGACGSCWAFSTTGSLEGQHFKKTGQLVSLSEQNLVDCSKKEGNDGCGGGLMDFGFEYVEKNGGIDTEASYPYKAKNGRCHYTAANSGATCSGCVDVKKDSETDLQDAVATIGPISIAMDAHLRSFMLYKSGIYYDKKCSSTQLDHGILVVGYGSQGASEDFWTVKNSWGTSWGMQGYFMLARNRDNACGVSTAASYPLV